MNHKNLHEACSRATTHRLLASLLAIVLGGGLPSCSTAAQARPTRDQDPVEVTLRPGDRVRLKVWREPDLSGDFSVDETGIVVFPKIGRIDVHNLSTDSLKSLLLSGYSASLRNPAVEVTVLRRINMLGAVRN